MPQAESECAGLPRRGVLGANADRDASRSSQRPAASMRRASSSRRARSDPLRAEVSSPCRDARAAGAGELGAASRRVRTTDGRSLSAVRACMIIGSRTRTTAVPRRFCSVRCARNRLYTTDETLRWLAHAVTVRRVRRVLDCSGRAVTRTSFDRRTVAAHDEPLRTTDAPQSGPGFEQVSRVTSLPTPAVARRSPALVRSPLRHHHAR